MGSKPQRLAGLAAASPFSLAVLASSYAIAAFLSAAVVIGVVHGHTEDAETLLYVATLVGIPAVAGVAAAAIGTRAGGDAAGLRVCAGGSAAVVALAVVVQRLAGGAPPALRLALLVACLPALLAVALRSRSVARSLPSAARAAGIVVPGAAGCAALAVSGAATSRGTLATAIVVGALAFGLRRVLGDDGPPRWAGRGLDALFVLVLLLALLDLAYPEPNWRIHGEYYVGNVNDVLHGRTVLVDTASQYGIAVVYALAAVFAVVPLSLGSFMLVVSVLTAAQFAIAYASLRMAGAGRATGMATVAVAVLAAASYAMPTPNTSPLRFGLPYVVIALALLAVRGGRLTRLARIAAAATVGLAAIWAVDTFAQTAAAFVAVSAVTAATEPAGRLRAFAWRLAEAALACVLCGLALIAATRLAGGLWPDASWYLDLVGVYTREHYGQLPIQDWSPAYLLFAGYVVTALGVAAVLATGRADERNRPALVALAGFAAYGAVLFSYFAGRSHPIVLWDVAAPGILMAGCWIALLERSVRLLVPAAVAVAAGAGAMLVARSDPPLRIVTQHSALAAVLGTSKRPGSLTEQLENVWRADVHSPLVSSMTRLIDERVPADAPVAVLASSFDVPEALLKTDRMNALPIADAVQDFLTADAVRRVTAAALNLRAGTILITHRAWLADRNPPPMPPLETDPLHDDVLSPVLAIGDGNQWRLAILVVDRYVTREVGSSPDGLVALRIGALRD